MQFKQRTLMQLGDLICGNGNENESFFRYRSSSYLSEFFQDCDTDYCHDGSTRGIWVADTLKTILAEPHPNAQTPPETFSRVIRVLMDQGDARNEEASRTGAIAMLTAIMAVKVSSRSMRMIGCATCATLRPTPSRRPIPVRTAPSQPPNANAGSSWSPISIKRLKTN